MEKYRIDPVSKPRMTRRDRWAKRPAVLRYWGYKDQVIKSGIYIEDSGAHITFILPMPKSWSAIKKNQMRMQAHQQKPDKDNLEKGLLDAIFEEDCRVWDSRVTKLWGDHGEIWIDKIKGV